MTYNYKSHKIVAVIADNLEPWQAMNVLGHMAVSLGAHKDDMLMGRDTLLDKEGVAHKGIARFGFIIKKGTTSHIAETISQARTIADLTLIDFPRDMLDTRHDDELAQSIQSKSDAELEYLGVLLYGSTDAVNSLTQSYVLYN